MTIPGEDLTGGKAGTQTSVAKGTADVRLERQPDDPEAPGTVAITNGTALADGAATLNINWNLYDSNGNPT